MPSYYGPELMHYGIEGMRWGIRRYQPYPKGYDGKGKFTGEGRKASPYTRLRGVHDARLYQNMLSAKHYSDDVKALKNARKSGEIDKATYKAERKALRDQYVQSRAYVISKRFKGDVLDYATNKNYDGMVQRFVDKVYDELPDMDATKLMEESSAHTLATAGKAYVATWLAGTAAGMLSPIKLPGHVGRLIGGAAIGAAYTPIARAIGKTSKIPQHSKRGTAK